MCPDNALLYHWVFRFQDPIREGRLIAVIRDTWDADLADVSWGVHAGCLRETTSGRTVTWTGAPQICPQSDELKAHFVSRPYHDLVWKGAAEHRYAIDWEPLRARMTSPAGPGAEETPDP